MTDTWKLRIRSAEVDEDRLVILPIGATVGQLAEAVGLSPDLISIDGEAVSAHRSLTSTGARNGSIVGQLAADGTDDGRSDTPSGIVTLDQVAGLSGVGSTPLAQGRYDFTPSSGTPTTDYRVSDISFTLDVGVDRSTTVIPRGRPVVVDNVLLTQPRSLGDDVLHVGSARFVAHRTADPEQIPSPHVEPRAAVSTVRRMHTPPASARAPRPLSMSWLALAPLAVVFGVLGLIVHELFFVAAAATLALAIWYVVTHMRSERRAQALHHTEVERQIGEFEERVKAERRSLAKALRDDHPSIADTARLLAASDVENRLVWNRNVGDHDFGLVSLGLGDLSWKIQTEVHDPAPPVQAIIHRNGVLPSVPIVADVADGTIGIAGERASALSCARAIITTLAAQSPPEDQRIAVCAENDRLADWDWIKWLPHAQLAQSVATTPTEADRLVSSWRTPGHEWLQIVIVDEPEWAREERSLLHTAGREPGKQVLIVLADHLHRLPDCASTIDLGSDGTATVRVGTTTHRFVTPVGCSAAMAEEIACGLAKLSSRDQGGVSDEVTSVPFVLSKRRPDPVLRARIDAEEDEQAELDGTEQFDRTEDEAPIANLVPPPIPAEALLPPEGLRDTIDLTDRPVLEPEPSAPIDLRDRVDALADVSEPNQDDQTDLIP